MTYAYDNYVQLPVVDLYDSSIMQMAINAAKDQYDRGQKQIEDFYTKYGDFMSPFAKDMERYGLMMGGINNILNDAYSKGIDLTKSPEGRALINRLVYSVNPQEYNMMRSNAKTGYAYLDAILKLRSQGKYSEALELFDIARSGGINFNDFSTLGENGFNTWDRTSPIEAASLLDLTYNSYKDRSARDVTVDELRAMGYPADPRYQYTGYLDSDLMKVAPGAAMAIAADPRAAYFRDLAEKKVAARGGSYTQADVDAQFYRDIANANKWALIDPQKKADEFALDDYRTKNDIYAHSVNAATDYYYKHKDDDNDGNGNGKKDKESGWGLTKDFYVTSLAKAAGEEYPPEEGVDQNQLSTYLKNATKRQKEAINRTGNVLTATGMFMAPQKIGGLIQSKGANGNGYFLDVNYLKNLHTEDDIRSSYKGWRGKRGAEGTTAEESKIERDKRKQESKDFVSNVKDWTKSARNKQGEYRIKVVPVSDKNENNVYGIAGDDGRWHTYARVMVYASNGKNTTTVASDDNKTKYIPAEGREMLLEIGLHSNEGKASPDLSVSAREDLGFFGYHATKKEIGMNGNEDWPYGNNRMK